VRQDPKLTAGLLSDTMDVERLTVLKRTLETHLLPVLEVR
jgi:hypothetical protein